MVCNCDTIYLLQKNIYGGIVMYKIVVCEDDKVFCEHISSFIKKYFKKSCNIIKLNEPSEIVYFFEDVKERIDIIFMDVALNQYNGIDIIKKYQSQNSYTKIIYVSSYKKYMSKSFETEVSYFLEKPISYTDVKKALDKVIKSIKKKEREYFFLKIGHGYQKVYVDETIYIESNKRKIKTYLTTKKVIVSYDKISDIEKKQIFAFMRSHQSYLVNFNYIIKVEEKKIFLQGNKYAYISKSRYKEFMQEFRRRLGEDNI